MKTFFRIAVLTLLAAFTASFAAAGVFEPWTVLDSANIGTYQDPNGSVIMFLTTDGPKAGEKALKIESTLKPGGYCGIWHNIAADLSKAGAVKFMARSTKPGELQLSLKDKNNVQYIAFVQIPPKWGEVSANFASFKKDPYYTPPDAVLGKPMDLTETKGINFGPKMEGDATILIGPIFSDDASKDAPQAAAPAAEKPATAAKPKVALSSGTTSPSRQVSAAEKKPATEGKVGGALEPWTAVDSNNAGTYFDSTGSKISFTIAEGPKKGEKALKILGDLKAGGYIGIWHNLVGDLSKAMALRFKAKSSPAQDVQVAIKDNNNIQYVAKFSVGTAWADVTVPLSDFSKDPYYTPPDAVLGKPMDVSVLKGLNFAPQGAGAATLAIGPVMWVEGEFKSVSVAHSTGSGLADAGQAAEVPQGTGERVTLQEFTVAESGICGTYADTTGSKIEYLYKDAPKRKGQKKDAPKNRMMSVTYKLVSAGWCGIWYRAGDTWDGVNASGAVAVELTVYTEKPMVLGMALKDKTNNQYVADGPITKGGNWETVTIPVSSFKKDPYYTPEDAIQGAPQDLSQIKTFNVVPKTEGEGTFAVDKIEVVK